MKVIHDFNPGNSAWVIDKCSSCTHNGRMSTRPTLCIELAPLLATHPATIDRYFRAIPEIRRSKGRNSRSHLDCVEIASLFLAYASPSFTGAEAALLALASLRREEPLKKNTLTKGLLNELASIIENRAIEIHQKLPSHKMEVNWSLTLSLMPIQAFFISKSKNKECKEFFVDPYRETRSTESQQYPLSASTRQLVLNWPIFEKAAEMALDGMRQTKNLPQVNDDPVSTTTGNKTTTAGEAPPSTSRRVKSVSKSKQAVDRSAPVASEQPNHTLIQNQSESRDGLSASSTGDTPHVRPHKHRSRTT